MCVCQLVWVSEIGLSQQEDWTDKDWGKDQLRFQGWFQMLVIRPSLLSWVDVCLDQCVDIDVWM